MDVKIGRDAPPQHSGVPGPPRTHPALERGWQGWHVRFHQWRKNAAPCLALLSALLALGPPSQAQTTSPYRLVSGREWMLLGTGATLGTTSLALRAAIEPLTAQQIALLDFDDVNEFDRRNAAPYREDDAADALLIASYAIPLTLLASSPIRRDWGTVAVMWTETTLLQLGFTGIVKTTAKRTRPYVYDPNAPMELKQKPSARMSFFSGHTTQSAANSFFAARVFSDYTKSTRAKVLVWTGAALYPALVGHLRRETGHHFNTDVIVGYCVGALIGYLVPELHRARGHDFIRTQTIQDGVGIGLHFAFR